MCIYSYLGQRNEARAPKAFSGRARETHSACIYENLRQRIKSMKMVSETSDKNQFSYIYVLNPFIQLTRPEHDAF